MTSATYPRWLIEWMNARDIVLWGAADLRPFDTPLDAAGHGFPRAVAWVIPMDPHIMSGIRNGPTRGIFLIKPRRQGLGWIGRHCQLITWPFGLWIRLGSVFTDLELPCGICFGG